MPNLTLRGCCIGTGRPKVIIPIVERTESAILEKAAAFSTLKADCVEWRADWFDAVSDVNTLAHCLHGLRAALGEKLLLDFVAECADIATMEKNPKLDGRHMSMFLSPKKQ